MSQPAEEPPRKRQRVTQACHRCRRKKYKCDSERPTCSTCRSSHSECTYGTVAKRRGLQSGYVRAVEVLWGLVFKRIEGSQLAVNDLLVNLSNIISPSPNDASNNDIGSDRADALLECWRNSGVPSAIESMLDGAFTTNQIGMSQDLENQIDLSLTSVRNWSLPQSDLLEGTPPQVLSPPPIAQTPQPTVAGVISDTAYPPENTFPTSLILIGRQFGAQAMPASASVLISSFPSRKYKALWGWDHEPCHQEEVSADTTMVNQIQINNQLLPSLTSQDPLHAAMHCEMTRGLSATFNLESDLNQTDGQASVADLVASGQSDAAGLDPNLMTFDDVTASAPDSMLADTPTQLLDYLALLQQNESVGNSQDFMQSLGFFMDFDGSNT
ncbi:hypothetical protein KCU65_g9804, partial [Aureobasidium melanogenum]